MNHTSNFAIIKGGESAASLNEINEDLCADTVAFACISPEVFAATLGLVQLLGYHLRWHKSTMLLVTYITCALAGEDRSISLSQAKLGAVFYPRQSKKDQKKSAKRMIMVALTDMQASGCVAFYLKPGKIAGLQMVGKGKNRRANLRDVQPNQWIHSEYTQGVIHLFLNQVQERARKDDLFSFDADERNRRLYTIIQSVAVTMGFKPIEQAPDEGEYEEAKPKVKERVKRLTKAHLERGLDEWEEEGLALFIDGLNLKLPMPVMDSKLSRRATEARLRGRDAAARAKKQTLPNEARMRALSAHQENASTMLEQLEQWAVRADADGLPEVAECWRHFAVSLGDLRWAINTEREQQKSKRE